jgi:SRSO17 transposase
MTVAEIEALGGRLERFLEPYLAALPEGRGRGEGCTRRNFEAYFRGLLSGLERKSVEPIALAAGLDERALQLFLSTRPWDHHGLRDALQRQVAARAPDLLELAVIDETSHVKKGDRTPGVQRQWCGARGKVDNCIVTVHLAGARADGQAAALLDSDLYVPKSWTAARRRQAGMPADLKPQPKWRIALDQHARAAANGLRFAWLTADEGYGSKPGFLAELAVRKQAFAVEVPKSFRGWTTPPFQRSPGVPKPKTAENLARHSSAGGGWTKYHVKDTAKGATAWQVRRLPFGFRSGPTVVRDAELLVARNLLRPAEVKYFVAHDPTGQAPEREKVRAAFGRPAVEGCFQKAKGETGLSHYEGRTYDGLLRHCHLSALALAFLELETGRRRGKKTTRTGGDGAATPPRAGRPAGTAA